MDVSTTTVVELTTTLTLMYKEAHNGDSVTMNQLFGERYTDEIRRTT